jgi:hypothetical protein
VRAARARPTGPAAHFFKHFLWRDETLSTVPPDYYADRFMGYAGVRLDGAG